MPAGITETDGMAYVGRVPWHKLGTKVEGDAMTAKEAIEAEYEGTLRMTLDLAASGSVIRVHFLDHADHGVEQACRTAALDMRCRPARKDGVPVSVTGMPHRCTIKALD